MIKNEEERMLFSSVLEEDNFTCLLVQRSSSVPRNLMLTDLKSEPLLLISSVFQSILPEIQKDG